MFRRTLLVLCLASLAFAKEPRPFAAIPIHTPDGKTIDIRKAPFRGKPTVLMIFSTACNECVATLKLLDSIQKDYGKQGLQVLGAAGDDNARYFLTNFIARYRPSFPIGFWTKEEIIKAADVTKDSHPVVPILLFIDRGGTVRYQYFGDHPFFRDPEKNIRALSFGMIKVAPLPAGKGAAPTAAKQTPPQN